MKLYELAGRLLEVIASEDEFGESTTETLDKAFADFDEKCGSVLKMHLNLEAEASAYGEEAERLSRLAKSAQRKADWLKNYLKEQMVRTGQLKVKTDIGNISIRKNAVPTVVLMPSALPSDLPKWCQRTTVELDAKAVREAFVAGQEIPWQLKVELGTHLRIT